jgi:hypothetical protein
MIDVAQDHYLALLVCLRFRNSPCCLATLGWVGGTARQRALPYFHPEMLNIQPFKGKNA